MSTKGTLKGLVNKMQKYLLELAHLLDIDPHGKGWQRVTLLTALCELRKLKSPTR